MRKNLEGASNPLNLGLVATRTAGDISNTHGNLILRSKSHKAEPLIKLPLSDEKHYEVSIFNEPAEGHEPDKDHNHDHSGHDMPENGRLPINHFNVYYEALDLRNGAIKYLVEVEEDPGSTPQDPGPVAHALPFDPPCDLVRVSGIQQLPDFG
jgi:hypothetical protein